MWQGISSKDHLLSSRKAKLKVNVPRKLISCLRLISILKKHQKVVFRETLKLNPNSGTQSMLAFWENSLLQEWVINTKMFLQNAIDFSTLCTPEEENQSTLFFWCIVLATSLVIVDYSVQSISLSGCLVCISFWNSKCASLPHLPLIKV